MPRDLAREPCRRGALDRREVGRARAELGAHAGHGARESARDDQAEVREVWIDVERQPVQRDEAREPHADRRDLPFRNTPAHPHAGGRGIAESDETVLGQHVDHALFEKPDVRVHPQTQPFDVDDRIGDQLPRPVVGHISAAIRLDALDPVPGEQRVIGEHVRRGFGPTGHRHDRRRMLKEKDAHRHASRAARDNALVRRTLDRKRIAIGDAAEVNDLDEGVGDKRFHQPGAYAARRIPYNRRVPKIHPTAILDGDIQLADDVEIGPLCVLRGRISIGAGTILVQGVHLEGPLSLGAGNTLYPGAALGFAPQDKGFARTKEGSGTIVGDGNVFREHSTVHRATRDDRPTRVGDRNYFMACAHAAHDVQIGNDCTFANGTLFAGHVEVGDRVVTGGGAAIQQFSRVGRGAMVGGLVGMTKDICPFFTASAFNYVGGYNRIGMRRSGMPQSDIEMVRTIYGILVRSREIHSTRVARVAEFAGHPIADEFLAFIKASKRGIATRHGRITSARDTAGALAGAASDE